MSPAPQTRFLPHKIRANRLARNLLWPRPALYFPLGILRRRGNVFNHNVHLHISGYPRSGNTFARTAFLAENPGLRICSHRHIPTFVLQSVRRGIPGIVLIRNPLDAALSWAIHQNRPIEECIAYWNDYYRILMPIRSHLFVARFEDVTTDFGRVMHAFNDRWGTTFFPFDHTPDNVTYCFKVIENDTRLPSGEIHEAQVSRPSSFRRMVKEAHLRQLANSPFLQEEFTAANDLYESFLHYRPRPEPRSAANRHSEITDESPVSIRATPAAQ
jgi:hypothetical protein